MRGSSPSRLKHRRGITPQGHNPLSFPISEVISKRKKKNSKLGQELSPIEISRAGMTSPSSSWILTRRKGELSSGTPTATLCLFKEWRDFQFRCGACSQLQRKGKWPRWMEIEVRERECLWTRCALHLFCDTASRTAPATAFAWVHICIFPERALELLIKGNAQTPTANAPKQFFIIFTRTE